MYNVGYGGKWGLGIDKNICEPENECLAIVYSLK